MDIGNIGVIGEPELQPGLSEDWKPGPMLLMAKLAFFSTVYFINGYSGSWCISVVHYNHSDGTDAHISSSTTLMRI